METIFITLCVNITLKEHFFNSFKLEFFYCSNIVRLFSQYQASKTALHLMGETDIDTDEVHCILSNLIYEGHIKGYISLQHQKLIISKQNPFPDFKK